MIIYIRDQIFFHYRTEKPINISKFNAEVSNDSKKNDLDFLPTKTQFWRILHGMGYRYFSLFLRTYSLRHSYEKIKNRPVLFEKKDIVEWRHNFLRYDSRNYNVFTRNSEKFINSESKMLSLFISTKHGYLRVGDT